MGRGGKSNLTESTVLWCALSASFSSFSRNCYSVTFGIVLQLISVRVRQCVIALTSNSAKLHVNISKGDFTIARLY